MQTRFNKSFANTDKNIPEDTIHNETISFVLSAHKEKMEKDTKGWTKFNFSLSIMLNTAVTKKKKFPCFI